ncbi:MAG TPA: BsuPI-related putative proteinase inhibitor [Actinomycetota bacterium]|nr:BsuPI-related putative proteinase inhibitor [Actinomycetota bacterium]
MASGSAGHTRPQCATPTIQELTPPTVDVRLDLSDDVLERGDRLRLRLTVRNNGPVPIPYSHGGQRYDFWIRDQRGLIWLWSQQWRGFTDELVYAYLMPGETHVARASWTRLCSADGTSTHLGSPGPGRYVARALWVSDASADDGDGDGSWWSNEVSFRIRGRHAP